MWTTSIVYTDDSLRWQQRLVRSATHELSLDTRGLKYLCESSRFQEVGGLLTAVPPGLVFLGGSSFHHLSYHLVGRCASRPLGIVIFDRHDDLLPTLPGHVACSSWLGEVVKLPAVSRVLVVGPGGGSLDQPEDWADDRAARRIARAATCAARLSADPAAGLGASPLGKVKWARSGRPVHELARFCDSLARGSSRPRIYVSIDKDVLAEVETDWGSGELRLAGLLELLAWLRQYALVVGADVSGELVPRGPWPTVAELAQIRKNEEINLAIARTLMQAASRTLHSPALSTSKRPGRPSRSGVGVRPGVAEKNTRTFTVGR